MPALRENAVVRHGEFFRFGSFDVSRTIQFGGVAETVTGSPSSEAVGLRLGAAYDIPEGRNWYLRPKLNLDMTYAQGNACSESSASGLTRNSAREGRGARRCHCGHR